MPITQKLTHEIYEANNGVSILVETIETQIEVATQEETIAEKEAQLLAIYEEIQALKNNN